MFPQYYRMKKRKANEVMKSILMVLSDNEPHAYGDIERKANTNWKTVRDHCNSLQLFDAAKKEDNKIKITKYGMKIVRKLKKQ